MVHESACDNKKNELFLVDHSAYYNYIHTHNCLFRLEKKSTSSEINRMYERSTKKMPTQLIIYFVTKFNKETHTPPPPLILQFSPPFDMKRSFFQICPPSSQKYYQIKSKPNPNQKGVHTLSSLLHTPGPKCDTKDGSTHSF